MSRPDPEPSGIEALLAAKRERQERVREAFARGEQPDPDRRLIAWEKYEIRIVRTPEW